MKIGFLTKYKHLPEFSSFVESKFECIDLHKGIVEVDYIFSAPNYTLSEVDDSLVENTKCKAVITPSTGTNHIKTNLVPIISIKNDKILESITSTAEHNLLLILRLAREIEPYRQLSSLNLGILGYGRLGKILHRIATPIFKNIYTADKEYQDKDFYSKTDILSINIDLTEDNYDFINKSYVEKFSKNIYIVNTARGEVVNEEEISILTYDGKVLGYGTDVIKEEFNSTATTMKSYYNPKIIVTRHIGGTAIEAQETAYRHLINKVLNENNI